MNFNRITKVNDPIFNLQWFKTNVPQKEEIIFGYVDNIGTSQVDVTILNYGSIKGIIAFNQLSSKKVRSIRTLFKEGDIKPFIVTDVIVKDDVVTADLSFKNINDYADEIAIIEKYYLLVFIMFRWFKDIYREQFFISSPLSKVESGIIEDQTLLNQQNAESIHDMRGLDRSISLSNIIDTNKFSIDTDDLNLDQYCNIEDNDQDNVQNQLAQSVQSAQSTPLNQNIAKIPFSKNEWNELMELTLWSYSFSNIYNVFLLIKTKKASFKDVFSDFYNKVSNGLYIVRNKTLTIQDIKRLELLIEKFISYNITINITLNLTCWAIKSLDKIKQIVHSINAIPDSYYESQISFESMMINSPKYEWTIKSSNKLVIDQLYQNENLDNADIDADANDYANDDDIEANNLNNKIIASSDKKYILLKEAFDDVLKEFDDIKYNIIIQREDKS